MTNERILIDFDGFIMVKKNEQSGKYKLYRGRELVEEFDSYKDAEDAYWFHLKDEYL
jgi:hypothetical protein